MAKPRFTGEKRLTKVSIEDLQPHPQNPRIHPQDQLDAIAASIRQFGQPRPVLARAEDHVLIAGHGVLEGCRRAGVDQVDVILWDVDQRTASEFMVADNQHGDRSSNDDEMLAQLIRDLQPENILAIGFLDSEVEDMISALEKSEKNRPVVRELATDEVADTFWISVRGPIEQQANALRAIQDVMAKFPDVTVDQGSSEIN